MNGKRTAIVIMRGQTDKDGQIIPSLVTEGEPGHSPLTGNGGCAQPWKWGTDYNRAEQIAAEANADKGLTTEDVIEIRLSSLAASRVS